MRFRLFDKEFTTNVEADRRQKSIQTSAYLKAEREGFPPGHEVRFWAEAEREYDAAQTAALSAKAPWERLLHRIGISG